MEASDCSPESVEASLPDEKSPKDTGNEEPGRDRGVTRAREILGSLKVRREELLQTVRDSRSNHARGDSFDISKKALSILAMNRTKTVVFDGKETQLLTAQMSKVLKERRDRLSRILAGLDPDGGEDYREASPVHSEASRSIDLGSLESSSWSFAASPGDANSPFRKKPELDPSSVYSYTSHPPTLEEIREAFNTDTTEESSSHETLAISREFSAEEDEPTCDPVVSPIELDIGTKSTPEMPSKDEGEQEEPSMRSGKSDLLDGSIEMASPGARRPDDDAPVNDTPRSNESSIRRSYSFEDTLPSARDEPSIRMTLSFNSSFLDSSSRLRFKPRSVHLHRVPTPPPSHPQCIGSGMTKTPNVAFGSLPNSGHPIKVKKCSVSASECKLGVQASGSGCDPDCARSTPLNVSSNEEDTKCSSPINFFPPEEPVARKAHCQGKPTIQSPVSTSSTLTSREDRANYLRALFDDTHVKRPVPRYPATDGTNTFLDEDTRLTMETPPMDSSGSNPVAEDVSEPCPPHQADESANDFPIESEKPHHSTDDDLSPCNSFSEDQSHLISDASSFDCTHDDTLTSGYLSFGTLERLSTVHGDDLTEMSILMPNRSMESLEGEDSVDRLLPPPPLSNYVTQNPVKSQGTNSPVAEGKLESCLHKETSRKSLKPALPKKVAFAAASAGQRDGSLVAATLPMKKPALYFVEEEKADARCQATGGLYSLALAAGLNLESPPLELLRIKPSRRKSKISMRLNPDFRCGARGSLYDICLQSGFDLSKPWVWRKKRRYMAVKGGLFDVALRSGLTMELLHSRGPLTIKTKPLSLCRQDDAEVLPEDVTDYECGATGNLFLAFESAGGDYVSKGSLYYLATQSGMKLGQ